jgi:xanthine/CO dehydrogenase XdhC/CoxF family maturation factor
MQKGVRIRLVARDGREGKGEGGLGFSGGKHYWVKNPSALEHLGLSAEIVERLRSFWYGDEDVLFFDGGHISGQDDFGKIIAERISGQRCLFVFGAGHVGRSVALMGAMMGLQVILADDRIEFLQKDDLVDYGIELLAIDFSNIPNSLVLDRQSAVVIVTRGHQYDETILRQMASYEIGYVGMIGSRRRVEGVFRRLRQQGIEESFLRLVKAPIGLEIGARTPQEIAVAVHAEMIKHFNVHA